MLTKLAKLDEVLDMQKKMAATDQENHAEIKEQLKKQHAEIKENQEVVKKDLDRCMINAIQSFSNENQGNLPTKIIIYRDGVGEGQRDQIVEKEIS